MTVSRKKLKIKGARKIIKKNKNKKFKSCLTETISQPTLHSESCVKLCTEVMYRAENKMYRVEPLVTMVLKLLLIFSLIKFCAAGHYCPPTSDKVELSQTLRKYTNLYQNIKYLDVKKPPKLGEKVALIIKDYTVDKYSHVEWSCSRQGTGFTTLKFNHDELYLLQKFSQKWELDYNLLLFARLESRRVIWPNGDFTRFYDGTKVEFLITCPAERNNFPGVLLLTFPPGEKAIFRQSCDEIYSNSSRPAAVCIQDDNGLSGRKIKIHGQLVDEILAFKSNVANQEQYRKNLLSLNELKSFIMNNTAEYTDCFVNNVQLFNNSFPVTLANASFPDISLVGKLSVEDIKENYKNWKVIQSKLLDMHSQIQNAIEKSRRINYYEYKTRTVGEFFSKKYFEELYDGNLANIFSFTFLVLCLLIILVATILLYKCCLKGCVAKLKGIFCPYFIFNCCTTLTRCCTGWCQPSGPQVIYVQAPVRSNPSFQPRPRRNQLMLQDNVYEDLFEEIN